MKVLHLCSYYIGNKLYSNMFKQISLEGHDQEVFIPVRKKEQIGINQLSKEYKNVSYYYRPILKKYHRLFYLRKVNKQKNEIKRFCNQNALLI